MGIPFIQTNIRNSAPQLNGRSDSVSSTRRECLGIKVVPPKVPQNCSVSKTYVNPVSCSDKALPKTQYLDLNVPVAWCYDVNELQNLLLKRKNGTKINDANQLHDANELQNQKPLLKRKNETMIKRLGKYQLNDSDVMRSSYTDNNYVNILLDSNNNGTETDCVICHEMVESKRSIKERSTSYKDVKRGASVHEMDLKSKATSIRERSTSCKDVNRALYLEMDLITEIIENKLFCNAGSKFQCDVTTELNGNICKRDLNQCNVSNKVDANYARSNSAVKLRYEIDSEIKNCLNNTPCPPTIEADREKAGIQFEFKNSALEKLHPNSNTQKYFSSNKMLPPNQCKRYFEPVKFDHNIHKSEHLANFAIIVRKILHSEARARKCQFESFLKKCIFKRKYSLIKMKIVNIDTELLNFKHYEDGKNWPRTFGENLKNLPGTYEAGLISTGNIYLVFQHLF